ncbi:hypothetical protein HG531_012018 [Fusarium graminearum]|nr:hypothetical protein HG531_012018 [Fusarium graminearum]
MPHKDSSKRNRLLLTFQSLNGGSMRTLLLLHKHSSVLHICPSDLSNIHSIVTIEVLGDFFHGCVPSLDKEEVNDVYFKSKKHAIYTVVFPTHGVKRDAVDVLVEEQCGSDTEVEPNKGQSDESVSQCLVGVNLISSRDNGPEVEDDACSNGRGQINRSTTEVINEEGKGGVDDQTLSLHTGVDTKLSLSLGNAHSIHDTLEVVGDQTIATPLTEESKSCDKADSLPVALCLQKVCPPSLSNLLV